MASCLIVEDAPQQATNLALTLRAEGHEAIVTGTLADAQVRCSDLRPDVVLLDLGLPDGDGLDLIPILLARCPLVRIIILTGRDSVAAAVGALHAGARHYLVKPWDQQELLLVVAREARAVALLESTEREHGDQVFWGRHPAMKGLRAHLQKLAASPTTPLLIEGETGSGKEVVARELHRLAGAPGPFVALNCGAIPAELLESELFGHERGAFTGAESRRRGLVELARDGTLFLDEVGEMAPLLQSKLLRFLEDHRFRRVGGEEELLSPCRVVAATHRDLTIMQETGRFRSDLYFRLAVVRLVVPPLRNRKDDVLPLCYFLLSRLSTQLGRPVRQLSAAAERAVIEHPWLGNVRELRNRLERALVLGEGPHVEPQDLDLEPACPLCLRRVCVCDRLLPPEANCERPLAESERVEADRIAAAFRAEGLSIARTARRLGVSRHWLKYRLAKYGLGQVDKK